MALVIFNGALTTTFQPTIPSQVKGEKIALDFVVTVANTLTPAGTHAEVQWYPEFTDLDPNAAASQWYRESSEENQGNGNILMVQTIRQFAEYGSVDLSEGTFTFDTQFRRVHAFFRLQVRITTTSADTCSAVIRDPFGVQLQSA